MLNLNIKKFVKGFGADTISKDIASKKKRKSGVLKNSAAYEVVLSEKIFSSSWESKAGNTTKFDSVNMEKKYLVEKTSVDYKEKNVFNKNDSTLNTPLRKIDFLNDINDSDIFLDAFVILFLLLKNLVNVSIRKLFTLDIGLDKVIGKSSLKKLVAIRKLFLGINNFGETSTLSKFTGIICAFFTSESSLAQAIEKIRVTNVLVNTNLKKFSDHLDWTVVIKEIPVSTLAKAVCIVLSEFRDIQKAVIEFTYSDYADLVIAKWSVLIRKDAVRVAKANLGKKS
ncbi:hypothetical protein G9A89_008900 [Geosiphon pyriformis]|nr:hypothetical protein G9A89_008900 [Geosiphon pyriformis]